MTLRARLLSLTLSSVAVMAFTMLVLDLNSLAISSIEVARSSSDMAAHQVQSFIHRRIEETTTGRVPHTLEGVKRAWRDALEGDADITAVLEQTMAQSSSIVEIDVAGEDGFILSSSSPRQRGLLMRTKPDLRGLRDSDPFRRITAMFNGGVDYETRLPLGVQGQVKPLFTIQVLVSPVLLRAAIYPDLISVLLLSSVAVAVAFVLSWWAGSIALRPLAHIGHLIDDIAAGRQPETPGGRNDAARELAAIESKLSLLGERYRDAREDASQLRLNLEGVLEKLDAETRRHFENQIGLARRLTAINSLTGRVAHEIKNPLNSIALRLEMLRSRLADESPDTEAEFAILSEEVTRLDRVVRTFLDFNRPVELVPADLDVAAEADDILQLIEPEAARKGIMVRCERPGDPVIVRADAGLLRQALLNIVVNGIEAMDGGGELVIDVDRDGDLCAIRIADTGPGVAPGELDKIFQLYFTTKPHGSGIGLAMASRAVQLHGGSIAAESECGVGTTFRITLPLAGREECA